jgi:hypothetical protein
VQAVAQMRRALGNQTLDRLPILRRCFARNGLELVLERTDTRLAARDLGQDPLRRPAAHHQGDQPIQLYEQRG